MEIRARHCCVSLLSERSGEWKLYFLETRLLVVNEIHEVSTNYKVDKQLYINCQIILMGTCQYKPLQQSFQPSKN